MSYEIYRDDWGIPHLHAGDAHELAYAQGLCTAHDRAFQLELERHRAQGTSASWLGPNSLSWDVFARRARLEDTARRCFAKLASSTRTWLLAYVAGVNAGLPQGAARAHEFSALNLTPGRFEPWTPLSIWLSTHLLFAGWPNKLWREEVAQRRGTDELLRFAADDPHGAGSNGWLVLGSRTTTGLPILAGDPHRYLEAPGVYQQIRLACPEFDVLGFAVPGVPGIAHFGHAGTVAWSITNAMADCQDLYFEQLRRRDGHVEVLDADGWRRAALEHQTVAVAGGASVELELIETARGPVIIGGPDCASAVSLRHPPRVFAELGFDALPRLLRAKTVQDIDNAFDAWIEPVNVVQAADRGGASLHRVAGRVPRRHPDNCLRIVPGWDERHAWRGHHEVLPNRQVRAVAVMANERGLAAELGVEFAPPHRARRIAALLEQTERWGSGDMARIHMDSQLPVDAPLRQLLAEPLALSAAAERLRAQLSRWDGLMHAESVEAGAYACLRARLVHKLVTHPELSSLARLAAEQPDYPDLFHPWLDLTVRVAFAFDGLLRAWPPADLTNLVREALEETADAPAAPWGTLHTLLPWQALPSERAEPWPGVGGDHDCVLSTASVPGATHRCTRGPVARYVWDLARREDSGWVVPLGASGVASDPHQRDQLPLWLRGELVPVRTDWAQLQLERRGRRAEPLPSAPEAVHTRLVANFGTLRVVPVDPARDASCIHRWVCEPRAQFWGMGEYGPEQVLEIYAYLDSLETHHAYLLWCDQRPVGLLQTYDPRADPIADFYQVEPGDLGLHLLLGPPSEQAERGFNTALIGDLLSFLFADASVQRLVTEPDRRNERAITRLLRCGFTLSRELELPDKRAQLAFLTRTAFERERTRARQR